MSEENPERPQDFAARFGKPGADLAEERHQDGRQDLCADIMGLALDDSALGARDGLGNLVCRRAHEGHGPHAGAAVHHQGACLHPGCNRNGHGSIFAHDGVVIGQRARHRQHARPRGRCFHLCHHLDWRADELHEQRDGLGPALCGEVLVEPWGATGSVVNWDVILDLAVPGLASAVVRVVEAMLRKGLGKLRVELSAP